MRRATAMSLTLGAVLVVGTLVTAAPARADHNYRGGVIVVTPHVHHAPLDIHVGGLRIIKDHHYIHHHRTFVPSGSIVHTPIYDDGFGHGFGYGYRNHRSYDGYGGYRGYGGYSGYSGFRRRG